MTRKLALMAGVALAACSGNTDERELFTMNYQERPAVEVAENPTKNAYFGDLHVHTKNSFDAYITGTRTTADDAYRFAKGETIDNGGRYSHQDQRPAARFLRRHRSR